MKLEDLEKLTLNGLPIYDVNGKLLAMMSLEVAARTYMPKLVAVAKLSKDLCAVLNDRVHDHLKANEQHWKTKLEQALADLERK